MFDTLKMKLATRRIERKKDFAAADKRHKKDSKLKKILLWPFRMIGRVLRWCWDVIVSVLSWIWELICGINLIGLLNLALIIAIIVLFSLLILDILNVSKKPVVVMVPAKQAQVEYNDTKNLGIDVVTENNKIVTLPLKRDANNNLKNGSVVSFTKNTKKKVKIHRINGDVIVESRQDAKVLSNGTKINGNLYLQNMYKYVLPCNLTVQGNMFLRNVGMLQFCGDFNVSGNIYVSPQSSFGPLPRRAKIGGQIIL